MNRRNALLALLAITVRSVMGDSAEAQTTSTTQQPAWKPQPATIRIDLGQFREWQVQLKGETVTVTPEEIFKALKGAA